MDNARGQGFKTHLQKEKIKMHAHITTNQQAQQRSFLTECFQRAQTYAARSHSVWPAGIIKIHYRAMRWRLIPDDLYKCVEGVNSEKLSQELLDVQIIPLLSHAPAIKVEWQSAKKLLIMEHAGHSKYLEVGGMTSTMLSRARWCLCKGGKKNLLFIRELHLSQCASSTTTNCTLGSFGHNKCVTLSQFICISVIILCH